MAACGQVDNLSRGRLVNRFLQRIRITNIALQMLSYNSAWCPITQGNNVLVSLRKHRDKLLPNEAVCANDQYSVRVHVWPPLSFHNVQRAVTTLDWRRLARCALRSGATLVRLLAQGQALTAVDADPCFREDELKNQQGHPAALFQIGGGRCRRIPPWRFLQCRLPRPRLP